MIAAAAAPVVPSIAITHVVAIARLIDTRDLQEREGVEGSLQAGDRVGGQLVLCAEQLSHESIGDDGVEDNAEMVGEGRAFDQDTVVINEHELQLGVAAG